MKHLLLILPILSSLKLSAQNTEVIGALVFPQNILAPISNSSSPAIYRSSSAGLDYPFNTDGHLIIQPQTNYKKDIVFMTGRQETYVRMVILDDGNIGIGTSSPISKVDISSGHLNFDNGYGLTSDSGAAIYTGSGGQTFAIQAGGTSGQIANFLDSEGNNKIAFRYDGKVGIGTESPSELLEVTGNIKISGESKDLIFGSSATHIKENANSLEFTSHASLRFYIDEYNNSSDDKFQVFGNLTEGSTTGSLFTVEENGNVGVGIDNPTQKLQVAGTVYSTEVKVELAAGQGPDYVFEPDYNLRTLKETKEYITENKHLPEIPTAKEMETDGVDLGDMNMRLLKKIEELTLYQIELLERLEKAEVKIQQLENK